MPRYRYSHQWLEPGFEREEYLGRLQRAAEIIREERRTHVRAAATTPEVKGCPNREAQAGEWVEADPEGSGE